MAGAKKDSSPFIPILAILSLVAFAAVALCFIPVADCSRCDASGALVEEGALWICPNCGGDGRVGLASSWIYGGSAPPPHEMFMPKPKP